MDWWTNNATPTFDEYMTNRGPTIGIELYSLNFYFLGPHLSQDLFRSEEYYTLFKHASIVGGLFNDYQGLKVSYLTYHFLLF